MKSTWPVFLGLILLAAPAAVQAQLEFTTNAGAITITNYNPAAGGIVSIPSATNGLPVTSIGFAAFEGLDLTNVTIPSSVTNIADQAFLDCSSLTNVAILGGITSIGDYTFDGCASLTRLSIPGSVTSIGQYAFAGAGLTSVTIPGSVTNIVDWAFYDCPNLSGIFFKGNAFSVDSIAFYADNDAMIYYLTGRTGWSNTFAGLPSFLWNPVIQIGGANFGVRTNYFGFNITNTANIPFVVEVSTNLAGTAWSALQTIDGTANSFQFSEPLQTATGGRFYRVSSP